MTGDRAGSSRRKSSATRPGSMAVHPAVGESGPRQEWMKMHDPAPGDTGSVLWATNRPFLYRPSLRSMRSGAVQSGAPAVDSSKIALYLRDPGFSTQMVSAVTWCMGIFGVNPRALGS